jgi:hypothetical protein
MAVFVSAEFSQQLRRQLPIQAAVTAVCAGGGTVPAAAGGQCFGQVNTAAVAGLDCFIAQCSHTPDVSPAANRGTYAYYCGLWLF